MHSIARILAAIWHDPPWKPWGIHASVGDTQARIEYRGRTGKPPELILRALEDILDGKVAPGKAGELLEGVVDRSRLGSIARRTAQLYDELARGSKAESHERQAAIIPLLLAAILEEAQDKGLRSLAGTLIEAARLIVGRDPAIGHADVVASALDRVHLRDIIEDGEARAKGLVLINPFNPAKRLEDLELRLDAYRLAWFLLNYTSAIARILAGARSAGPAALERLLRDSAFLLLEPVWYASMGIAAWRYAPPADTRLPTHTVFDHINAALMTLLWTTPDRRLRGRLAIVDLAGVQGWIRESRALRDLWASSWIASLLAWKAVERLVEEYGPGVMVSPPARLTPFAAVSLILSKLPHGDIGLRLAIPTQGGGGLIKEVSLSSMLGLRYRWPVDPVTPSRLIIALPPGVDEEELREIVSRGVSEAWGMILGSALDMIHALSEIMSTELGRRPEDLGVGASLVDAARMLEAPLAVRVYTVSIEEAVEEARKLDEKHWRALYYNIALILLRERERRIELKIPGRRAGSAYYTYATEAHKVWRGGKVTCTVCGKAPAIIDGHKLMENAEEFRGRSIPEVHEVREDRLCPYCLAKRMLRTMLLRNLSRKLLGVGVSSGAEEKLRFATIDRYTSRMTLSRGGLEEKAKELASILGNQGCLKQLPSTIRSIAQVGNRFTRNPGNYISEAESIILEVAHDKALLDKILNELDNPPNNSSNATQCYRNVKRILQDAYRIASRFRSKYAILQMDVDFMGAGVLSGRLGLRPESSFKNYPVHIVNVDNPQAVAEFRKLHERLVKLVHSYEEETLQAYPGSGKNRLRDMEPTVVLTPSYHFAISRSLALQSMLDRETIGERGMIIYAGGDDLLAILPPVERGKTGYRYPALEAAYEARRSYWGASGDALDGFNVYKAREEGFDLVLGLAPALSVYGRSGAVYIVDIAVPMWFSLEIAGELEEAKDHVERRTIHGGQVEWYKDILIIASDSAGASILPFTWLSRGAVKLYNVEKSIMSILRSVRLPGTPGGDLSRSVFQDYTASTTTIYTLAERVKHNPVLAQKYVVRILDRNKEAKEIDEVGLHDIITKPVGGSEAYTRIICVKTDTLAGRMLSLTGYTVERRQQACTQLVSQVFLASKVLSGSM